jgi:hypothetical protein
MLIRIIQFIQPTRKPMQKTNSTDIIRSKLTRNMAATFKEVREELIMAMDDFMPMSGNGSW